MIKVNFYDDAADELLRFAVIVSKFQDKWIFCKHRERDTYELPGGHREENENILDTAKRELHEETGATVFSIQKVCVYSVIGMDNGSDEETFGMLYYADIKELDKELHSEIEKIILLDGPPTELTYPLIHPLLIKECQRRVQK